LFFWRFQSLFYYFFFFFNMQRKKSLEKYMKIWFLKRINSLCEPSDSSNMRISIGSWLCIICYDVRTSTSCTGLMVRPSAFSLLQVGKTSFYSRKQKHRLGSQKGLLLVEIQVFWYRSNALNYCQRGPGHCRPSRPCNNVARDSVLVRVRPRGEEYWHWLGYSVPKYFFTI